MLLRKPQIKKGISPASASRLRENYPFRGKDGFVFKTEKQGIEKVTKVLSEYGRQYLPITEVFIKKDIKSPMLYNLSIGGHFLEYEFEKLSNLENSIPALLEMYIQVCQLQRTL